MQLGSLLWEKDRLEDSIWNGSNYTAPRLAGREVWSGLPRICTWRVRPRLPRSREAIRCGAILPNGIAGHHPDFAVVCCAVGGRGRGCRETAADQQQQQRCGKWGCMCSLGCRGRVEGPSEGR